MCGCRNTFQARYILAITITYPCACAISSAELCAVVREKNRMAKEEEHMKRRMENVMTDLEQEKQVSHLQHEEKI